MRRTVYLLGLTVVGLVILTAPASANTLCVAGNLSGVVGTTCTIGDLQFSFGSYQSYVEIQSLDGSTITHLPGLAADSITFTPDTTPSNPGFALSANFTASSSFPYLPSPSTVLDVSLDFTAQIPARRAVVLNTTEVSGADFTPLNCNGSGEAFATSYLFTTGSLGGVYDNCGKLSPHSASTWELLVEDSSISGIFGVAVVAEGTETV